MSLKPRTSVRGEFTDCPKPLIGALLKAAPDLDLHGAAIDEDTDLAVLFSSNGGELDIVETEHDEATMDQAFRLVYGRDRVPPVEAPGGEIAP